MKGVRVGSKNDITMPATKVTVAKKKEEINAWNSNHNGKYNVGLRIRGRRFNSQP